MRGAKLIGRTLATVLFGTASGIACRDNDPPPSHYENLGTEQDLLLPPTTAPLDSRVLTGQAEWHALRDIELGSDSVDSNDEAKAPADAAPGASEAEIRKLIGDVNAVLDGGKLEELPDFFANDQSDTVKRLVETLPLFSTKLRELAEANPSGKEQLTMLADQLAVASLLKLDVGELEIKGAHEASGKLNRPPFPGLPAGAAEGATAEVGFVHGDDGYWYVRSPVVELLGTAEPGLRKALEQLDAMIAGIRSGAPPEQLAEQRDAFLRALMGAQGGSPATNPATPADAAAKSGESN
ncbi:MAG: hypothetical protein AABZ12_13375 [Planctomycetota bacterium]